MANFINLQIPALEVFGKNYLSWVLHAKMKGDKTPFKEKSKAMIFLHCHLNESLKTQYLMVDRFINFVELPQEKIWPPEEYYPSKCQTWVVRAVVPRLCKSLWLQLCYVPYYVRIKIMWCRYY